MKRQTFELLTQYGPIASIWLDGIAVPLNGDTDAFHCQYLYDYIHSLQPQVLVSYKQGITGTEDYFAPEHGVPDNSQDAKIPDNAIDWFENKFSENPAFMQKLLSANSVYPMADKHPARL